jgi:hypothetical protein
MHAICANLKPGKTRQFDMLNVRGTKKEEIWNRLLTRQKQGKRMQRTDQLSCVQRLKFSSSDAIDPCLATSGVVMSMLVCDEERH